MVEGNFTTVHGGLMNHIGRLVLRIALFGGLAAGPSHGATNVIAMNFSADQYYRGTSNPITIAGSLFPAFLGTIAVGHFGSLPDAEIMGVRDRASWGAVVATFEQFGAASRMGSGAGNQPGFFLITPGVQSLGTSFVGKNVYVLIGNAQTLSESRYVAVFKSATLFVPEPQPSVDACLTDGFNGAPPAGDLLLGSYGRIPVQTALGLFNKSIELALVPEPGAALLVTLGLAIVAGRRSVRKKHDRGSWPESQR